MYLALDQRGPLSLQCYRALRDAILRGALAPGAALPGSRTLARELGLSRNTLLRALTQLIEEGYAEVRGGAGTFVARELPIGHDRAAQPDQHRSRTARTARESGAPVRLSRSAQAAARLGIGLSWELKRDPRTIDFHYGDAAYQDLPLATWARLYARRFRRARVCDLAYRAPGGHPGLRAEIAAYLARARGVRCTRDQVIVTAGSQQAIDLCLRVLVNPGDRVALEEPHYPGFRAALIPSRARALGILVDRDGLRIDRLARYSKLRMLIVTPSHQFPTGAVLPAARRLWLLDWARSTGAYIIEDDYDGEFRYEGRPLESLQGRDEHDRVLYVGTFSKVMFPALRLGYVVVPESLVDAFTWLKAACDTGSPSMDQAVLAEFIADGHLERHVRRTRVRNAARRRALVAAIEASLGSRVRAEGAPAGLHVWLEIPDLEPGRGSRRLYELAREEGVTLHSGAMCWMSRPPHATYILGYTGLTPQRIEQGIARLARALDRLE